MAGIKVDLAYANRTITRPGLLFNRIVHRSIPQTLAQEAARSSALGETKLSVRNSRIILETGGAEKCLGQMTASRMLQKAGISSITIPKGMKKAEIGTALHAVMSRWPSATARILGEAEGMPGRMFLPEAMKQGRVFEGAKNGSVMDLYRLIRDGCSPDKLESIDLSKLTGHKPFFLTKRFGRTELAPFYWIAGHPNTPAPILLHLAYSGDGYALKAFNALNARGSFNKDVERKERLTPSKELTSFCLASKNKYSYDVVKETLAVYGEMSITEKYQLLDIINNRADSIEQELDKDSINALFNNSQSLGKLVDSASRVVREAVIAHPNTSIDHLIKLCRSNEPYARDALKRLDLRRLTPTQITLLACSNNPDVLGKLASTFTDIGISIADVSLNKMKEYVFDYFFDHYSAIDLKELCAQGQIAAKIANHPAADKEVLIEIIKKAKKESLVALNNLKTMLSAHDGKILEELARYFIDFKEPNNAFLTQLKINILACPAISFRALLTIASGADKSAVAALKMLDLSQLSKEDLLLLLCSQSEDVQKAVVSHIRTDSRHIGIDTNTDAADEMASRLLQLTPISIARARKLYAHATKMTKLSAALKAYMRQCAISSISGNAEFAHALDTAMQFSGPAVSAYNAIKEADLLTAEVLMCLTLSPVPLVSAEAKERFKKAAIDEAVHASKIPNIKKDIEDKLKNALGKDEVKATNAVKWLKKKNLITPTVTAYLQLNDLSYLLMESLTDF